MEKRDRRDYEERRWGGLEERAGGGGTSIFAVGVVLCLLVDPLLLVLFNDHTESDRCPLPFGGRQPL